MLCARRMGSGGGGVGQSTQSQGQEEPGRELGTTRVFLPSYSPELNPPQKGSSKRCAAAWREKSTESLHDKREEAESYLKELAADPERVKSLCGWGWLRDSLESLPLCAGDH